MQPERMRLLTSISFDPWQPVFCGVGLCETEEGEGDNMCSRVCAVEEISFLILPRACQMSRLLCCAVIDGGVDDGDDEK